MAKNQTNDRARILDIVLENISGYRGEGYHLTVEAYPATCYAGNAPYSELHRTYSGWQSKDYEFDGKHPLTDAEIGGLRIVAQATSTYDTARFYSWEYEFYSMYHVKTDDAERMVKVLRYLDKGMEAKTKEDGYPAHFGQYLARIATLLGCTGARITVPESFKYEWASDAYEYCTNNGEIAYKIQSFLEDRWYKKYHEQNAQEADAS